MAVAAGFPPEVLDEMRRHELESRRQRSSAQPLGHQLDQAKDRVKRLRGVEERAVARLQKAQEERYDAEEALAIAEAEVEELRERIAKLSDEEEDEEEAEAGAEGDGEYELEDAEVRTEGLAASAGGLVGVLEEECLRDGPVPARVSEALAAVKRSLSASRERSEAKSPAGTSAPRTPRPRSYAAAVPPLHASLPRRPPLLAGAEPVARATRRTATSPARRARATRRWATGKPARKAQCRLGGASGRRQKRWR